MKDYNKIANRIAETLKDRATVKVDSSFAYIDEDNQREFPAVFVEFKNEFDDVESFDDACREAIGEDAARVVSTYEQRDAEGFDVSFAAKVDGQTEANYYALN